MSRYETMAIEECFIEDLTANHDFDEVQAFNAWEQHKDKLFSQMWDEFSFILSETVGAPDEYND